MDHAICETHLLTKRDAKKRFRDCIFEAWRGCCAYCNRAGAQTLDHIKPRSRGGSTNTTNLVPACSECNRRKGSEEVFSWFRRQPQWTADREADILLWIHQHYHIDSGTLFLLATAECG
jgi:5-methylcytosine-specific restriction endonuclease McrA